MPFAATWMDLEIITLSEVGQTEEDRYYMISLICGSENTTQINTSMKQNRLTDIENKPVVAREEGVARDGLGVWD